MKKEEKKSKKKMGEGGADGFSEGKIQSLGK